MANWQAQSGGRNMILNPLFHENNDKIVFAGNFIREWPRFFIILQAGKGCLAAFTLSIEIIYTILLSDEVHEQLLKSAFSIKKRFLTMYANANAGHIGSSLSATEIMTFIFFAWMQPDDEVVLSKGHAAALLYSSLAEKGHITEEEIATFYKNGTYLAAHPPANKIDKIPFATGSLGHGLSLAAGLGLSRKLKRKDDLIFCITSDGELNEGSIWEAAMFIAHHNLRNVVWFIDKNNYQGFGATQDVINMDPLHERLTAFGFDCIEIGGHDFSEFSKTATHYKAGTRPMAVIANTIKGRSWQANANTIHSHYLPFKDTQYDDILQHLEEMLQQDLNQLKTQSTK